MNISLNWLKDYVDIPKKVTPEDLGLLLTTHTVEIEDVIKESDKFKNIVVGKILEINKHPNADRLQLALVDIGKEKLRVVCGAPNIKVGQLVPLAKVGAVLPNGMKIKEAKVRGEKSNGMLCADDELGLGDDHSGILILDKKAKIGQSVGGLLGGDDIIYEVDNKSITHRPDLWSHYGMAREVAAFLNIKFREYKADKKLLQADDKKVKLTGKVEDFELCPRYMAISMDGIKIEDSPKWMADKLLATGVRPINNIVDITNYVLLELGQPLHAFDAKFIGNKIVVRRAKNKEVIETIDQEKRELNSEDIVITDGKKPVALGGIMGGANSEINNNTESIVIESANFDFITIRKTSSKLGLRTESSVRFEKSLDPNLSETALIRTVELVKKLCPNAKVVSNLVDEKKFKLNQGPIELDLERLEKIIGEKIDDKKVAGILESLGFGVKQSKDRLSVTIPSWRASRDISIKEDLVEEITRIYGYDNLKPKMPKVGMESPEVNEERMLERKIKNILIGEPALTEVKNYSFVGEDQLKKLNVNSNNHIRLANPIAEHQTLLRQSLVPNIINNIKTNQANYDQIGIFELGSVYFPEDGPLSKDGKGKDKLPNQEKYIAIAMATSKKEDIYSKTKGVLENLVENFNLDLNYKSAEKSPAWSEAEYSADIIINKVKIGSIYKLSKSAANTVGVKKDTAIAEIKFSELFNIIKNSKLKKYEQSDKFPPVVRDLAFVVDAKILYNEIKTEIENYNELIKEVDLFDVYQGEKLGKNKKNLAFHIIYQAGRTLTAEEVEGLQKSLVKVLEKKFNARVRDF